MADYPLPTKKVGIYGGALKPPADDFSAKICATIAQHCPHIKNITKVGGNIVATDSCGAVVFKCPIPDTLHEWNAITCTLVLVDTNGTPTTVNLTDVLQKAQDDLVFSALSCVLSYQPVAPGSEPRTYDLSVILDKLKDRLSVDPATCELVLQTTGGNECRWSLLPLLAKMPQLKAVITDACMLCLQQGDNKQTVDLLRVFEKLKIEYNAEACEVSITVPNQDCIKFAFTDVIAKIKTDLLWDREKCRLKFTSPDGMRCETYDLGADILAKMPPLPVVDSTDGSVDITVITDPDTGQITYDLSVDLCCHYHGTSNTTIDPANPPQTANGPAGITKNDGDTLAVCHPNGMCYYTCRNGAFNLDYCKVAATDCCTYTLLSGAYDPSDTSVPVKAGNVNDGDTLIVKNTPNNQGTAAISFYTCVNGAWALDFICPIGNGCCTYSTNAGVYDPNTVTDSPPKANNVAEGDTLFAKSSPNAQGIYALSMFTCRNGVWSHDWTCPMRAGCCTFAGNNPQLIDPANPPAGPAGVYPSKVDGDLAIECHPNGISAYTCTAGAWAPVFAKTLCCHYHTTSTQPFDPANPPQSPPTIAGTVKSEGNTATVGHPNGMCAYTCRSGSWQLDYCVREGCCHYHAQQSIDVDPANPPQPPKAAGVADGDTRHSRFLNGDCYYTCVNGSWQLDYCVLDSTPEVGIGSNPPDKASGFVAWFNPVTCILRLCNDAGDWLQPSVVACQEAEPSNLKGGFQIWYKPSTDCLSILCEGVWIGVKGVTAEDLAQFITKSDINPQCVGGCFEVCGVRVGIATEHGRTIWNAANAVQFETGVAAGDVIESPVCGEFTTPECLAEGATVGIHTTLQFNHRNHTAGLFALTIEVSIDGGATWTRAELNGYVVGPPNQNNQTDSETSGTVHIPIAPNTTYEVKSRALANIASGNFVGEIPLNQFEVDWDFDYLSCETV